MEGEFEKVRRPIHTSPPMNAKYFGVSGIRPFGTIIHTYDPFSIFRCLMHRATLIKTFSWHFLRKIEEKNDVLDTKLSLVGGSSTATFSRAWHRNSDRRSEQFNSCPPQKRRLVLELRKSICSGHHLMRSVDIFISTDNTGCTQPDAGAGAGKSRCFTYLSN